MDRRGAPRYCIYYRTYGITRVPLRTTYYQNGTRWYHYPRTGIVRTRSTGTVRTVPLLFELVRTSSVLIFLQRVERLTTIIQLEFFKNQIE